MQKLAEAKALSTKAETFQSQGNYDYACRCYDKIIILLRESLQQATSQDTIKQIKIKIDKFNSLRQTAYQKLQDKEVKAPKISLFGFPGKPAVEIKKNIEPLARKQEGHIRVVNDKQPIFPKGRRQIADIDPSVAEIIVKNIDIGFKDIVGMIEVKAVLEEAVIRPRQRPDLYQGIRAPPRGILLYGPPGNGKTFICKALARQSGCTFFALSASSILNKLVGQSEKTIKRIFAAAEKLAPSIIFIDQIDSMLTSRSQNENDSSRRLKTEFLVLMDGINSPKSGQVLVMGATNLPAQLDSAAKRRFSKMVYIGHPDAETRKDLVLRSLENIQSDLSSRQLSKVVDLLEYYSISQIKNILSEVAMIPLRELRRSEFERIESKNLRKVTLKDFQKVISDRKPIVSKEELAKYKEKV